MTIDKSKALFDPGFNPILNHFIPVYLEFNQILNSTNKQSNRKKLYLVNAPLLKNSLKSTIGFWKGCMLWAVYLKNHFALFPQEIEGNTLFGANGEEIKFFEQQNELIQTYFDNYSKDIKKYIGISAKLPPVYTEIFEDYKTFSALNNHFISTKMTNEIKLPPRYDREYTPEETENIFNSIQEIIDSKDLSLFIELNC